MNTTFTNFCISKQKINRIESELNITKSRGPNGYPPFFYQKAAKSVTDVLYLVLYLEHKALEKIPGQWKIASVTPIFKGARRLVTKYCPVSQLHTDSKIFEKCMYETLYEHFEKHLSNISTVLFEVDL